MISLMVGCSRYAIRRIVFDNGSKWSNRWVSPLSCQSFPLTPFISWSNGQAKSNKITSPMEWNESIKKRAQQLIFGSRKYKEFTDDEQEIVNFYQKKILEIDGGVVLPNTRYDLDQHEAVKVFRAWQNVQKK